MVKGIDRKMTRRIVTVLLLATVALGYVMYHLINVQIINFEKYQQQAIEQQTSQTPIQANRGTIYDRNMKPLAVSVRVERIFISPYEITDPKDEALVADELSRILEVDRAMIVEKLAKKHRKDETIKQNVEKETADKVRQFIADSGISGIYLASSTRRSYPYGNLASHVIGFTTADEGRFGLEYQYDKYLKGIPGRIITAKNGIGEAMPFDFESFIDAKNGSNLVLTIDWSIQNFLEKSMDAAYAESDAKNRVVGIVMDVNNGEVLGMTVKPDFDLNDPYTLNPFSQGLLDALELTGTEYDKAKTEIQYAMWRNKAVTEPYEPGSTFKTITAATALEEQCVATADGFYCPGYYIVSGQRINCHILAGHGQVTFTEGVQKSCNPVFMMVAERVGVSTFMKYFEAFGYKERTGIDLPGEADSITYDTKDMHTVELATHSFGQTFKITPIQQITGIAAIANGGKLVTPHLVREIVDDNGNVLQSFGTQIRRTVISEETAKTIADILAEGVASSGSSRNAYVKGYRVAAKTGTSQKRDDPDPDKRIGSCMGFAPADNPQVICIVIVDEPAAGSNYGGVNAAPYVSKILGDILPYLGVEPQYSEKEKEDMDIPIKEYRNTEVFKAKNELEDKGLDVSVVGEGIFVTYQIPTAGSKLSKGGSVILYTDNIKPDQTVEVPNVISQSASQVNKTIINAGLNLSIIGAVDNETVSGAIAVTQTPAAGEHVPIGTIVTVEFRHYEGVD